MKTRINVEIKMDAKISRERKKRASEQRRVPGVDGASLNRIAQFESSESSSTFLPSRTRFHRKSSGSCQSFGLNKEFVVSQSDCFDVPIWCLLCLFYFVWAFCNTISKLKRDFLMTAWSWVKLMLRMLVVAKYRYTESACAAFFSSSSIELPHPLAKCLFWNAKLWLKNGGWV